MLASSSLPIAPGRAGLWSLVLLLTASKLGVDACWYPGDGNGEQGCFVGTTSPSAQDCYTYATDVGSKLNTDSSYAFLSNGVCYTGVYVSCTDVVHGLAADAISYSSAVQAECDQAHGNEIASARVNSFHTAKTGATPSSGGDGGGNQNNSPGVGSGGNGVQRVSPIPINIG